MCAMKAKRPQRAPAHAAHSSNKAASKAADRGSSGAPLAGDLLKDKQRSIRDGFPEDVGLRVHRAISWLQRAEREQQDEDAAFIFYWIAFNAAYADSLNGSPDEGERRKFEEFFRRLTDLDRGDRIYRTIWDRYPREINLLLQNRYVFGPFWNHYNRIPGNAGWQHDFDKAKERIQHAIKHRDTRTILATIFDRLYILRNQLVHGGATWNSSVNRDQVRDGAKIMAALVPVFIDLMMDNPDEDWGKPHYPVVA